MTAVKRDHVTWNPCQYGSRSSTKMVLIPVIRAQPAIDGTIAGRPASSVTTSTRPSNSLPMMLSWTKSSPACESAAGLHADRRAKVLSHNETGGSFSMLTHT